MNGIRNVWPTGLSQFTKQKDWSGVNEHRSELRFDVCFVTLSGWLWVCFGQAVVNLPAELLCDDTVVLCYFDSPSLKTKESLVVTPLSITSTGTKKWSYCYYPDLNTEKILHHKLNIHSTNKYCAFVLVLNLCWTLHYPVFVCVCACSCMFDAPGCTTSHVKRSCICRAGQLCAAH